MSTLCKTRRSGLFVPWGRFLLIFGHPQNCKREGGFDPSVFTLSSMFPFLEGKSTNYPALWFLYLLHFSTGPRDHSQNVLERSWAISEIPPVLVTRPVHRRRNSLSFFTEGLFLWVSYRRFFGFSLRFRWEFDFMLQFPIEEHQNL